MMHKAKAATLRQSRNIKYRKYHDFFFFLTHRGSRHVKPSSAKGEKRLKRKKIPKFVQAEALPESEIMYKSKDHSVHLEQQVEFRKKVESGSTIAIASITIVYVRFPVFPLFKFMRRREHSR